MSEKGTQSIDLRRFDLNLLVILDALLTERHVTRAGQRLHLTQSAASAALARLRRVFEDPLLVPRGRELQLTPLGQRLSRPVREILRDVNRVLGEPELPDHGLGERTFVIQASDYAATVLLQPLLPILAAASSNLTLRIEAIDESFSTRLQRDDVDLLIAPMHSIIAHRAHRFPHETLFTDELVAVVCRDHPSVGEQLTVEQVRELPHLLHSVPGGEALGSFVAQELAARDIVRTIAASAPSATLMPLLLRGTSMVAFLPSRLAHAMQEVAHLRVLASPVSLPALVETMFWPAGRDRDDPAHLWLRRQIRALAAGLRKDESVPG
jgi:DNA-binding transcriptional LysR family regulator